MRTDHDEVDAFRCRGLDDRFARITLPDQECGRHAEILRAGDQPLGYGLPFIADLVDPRAEATAGQSERARVDDAHGDEPRAQADGQAQRLFFRGRRGRRQISGEEYRRDRDCDGDRVRQFGGDGHAAMMDKRRRRT